MYFLKKNGNKSVHSGKVKKDAITALECLQRSFEVAINYSVYNQGANTNILKLNYDVELLVTDKKSKKSLKERYEEEKARQQVKEECVVKKTIGQAGLQKRKLQDKQRVTAPNERNEKQKSCVYSSKRDKKQTTRFKISLFWKFVIVLSSISLLGIVFLVVAFSLTH